MTMVVYNPRVAAQLNQSPIWNKSQDDPGWANSAWQLATGIVQSAGGNSSWKHMLDEFTEKTWATDYGRGQAALAVKRFYSTASGVSMNPEWNGNTEVSLLNKAADHETSSMAMNIANRFFAKLNDFDSGEVQKVGTGGAPDLTPGGKGLLIKAGQTALSVLSGDELTARGQLIDLGKTELGPLLHSAFQKLPHNDWMQAIEKEWDVEDANFQDGEQVVTQGGRLATVKKAYIFKKDVVTVTLAETGKVVDVKASMLNRVFKRGEWTWTARFEPIAGKVVKSIALIIRVQKTNLFYQLRKLSDGTEDLFLAKHMLPMALKYQAVLNSTPMVQDFRSAALIDSKVKLSPCDMQLKMETSLAMHEGRNQYDNKLTRELITQGDANNLAVARAIEATQTAEGFGIGVEGGDLPWESIKAKQLVGIARTGQSWLDWLTGPQDFPLAVKEKRRRLEESAGLRRRLPQGKRERSEMSVYSRSQSAAGGAGLTLTRAEQAKRKAKRAVLEHVSRSRSNSPRGKPTPRRAGEREDTDASSSSGSDSDSSDSTAGHLAAITTTVEELQGKSSAKAQITAMPAANVDHTSRVSGTEPVEEPASYLPVLMILLLIMLLIYM